MLPKPGPSAKPEAQSIPKSTHATEQVPNWLLDLLLGIAVTLVIAFVITADYRGRQEPDALAYLIGVGFGALMLLRRRYPVGVLVATMLLLFIYYILGYPAIGLAVPVAAALFSAAELAHLTAAVIVSFILIAVSTYFRLRDGEAIAFLFGYELVTTVALMAASIALGDSMRARRALRAEQEQTAFLIEQEHRRRADQQIQAERLHMARDLHDTIGHSISVITLQADVAKEAIGHNDEQARQALGHIRTVSSQAMRELRATVKLLRNPEHAQAGSTVTSLANLSSLLEGARASGLNIDVKIEGDPNSLSGTIPGTVETAAYRIIQESLTNVMRHANATEVSLLIEIDTQSLRLQLRDNGNGALGNVTAGSVTAGTITPGSGITGMAERARLLGGTLTAQPLPEGGFVVNAMLPLQEEE